MARLECFVSRRVTTPFAVVGIFSHGRNAPLRAAARSSYLSATNRARAEAAGAAAFFVVRGGAAAETAEARRFRDVVILPAPAGLGRIQHVAYERPAARIPTSIDATRADNAYWCGRRTL